MITRAANYRQRQRRRKNQIYTLISTLSTKSLAIVCVHVLFSVLIVLVDDLDNHAKISLFAFLSAMILWVATKIPAGFVAVALLVFIVLMKAADAELLYHSLSEDVVWLMIGSFVIGEAVKQSGLAERFSRFILNRSTNKNSVLFGIASGLLVSAFFIPSTSGRAALSMPIIKQLNKTFSANEQSVLAILAPTVILMSTSATLIGAGSHLIGIGLLESTAGQSISYIQWLIWGVPFTLFVTFLACIIIKWMLWPKDVPKGIESVRAEEVITNQPMNKTEIKTLILISLMVIGWVTESIHGYDLAFITILGALLFMLPNYGVISWKQGVKSVSWNLILFVAAATALGKVLVDTGVVSWMEKEMLSVLHLFVNAPEWLIVLIILIVAVTSHLYITSHTTRAVVFIPSLLLFSETIGVNPSTVVFLSLIGMNYCITVPVSSKALLLFYEEGEISYDAKHLVKISTILMPLYIITMIIFYYSYWQWTGMSL